MHTDGLTVPFLPLTNLGNNNNINSGDNNNNNNS